MRDESIDVTSFGWCLASSKLSINANFIVTSPRFYNIFGSAVPVFPSRENQRIKVCSQDVT